MRSRVVFDLDYQQASMTRKSLTLTAMVDAFKAYALCPDCGKPYEGDVEFEHDISLREGGGDYDTQTLIPIHKDCHKVRTKAKAPRIAKVKRTEAKHANHLTRMNGEEPPQRKKKRAIRSGNNWPPKGSRKIPSRKMKEK